MAGGNLLKRFGAGVLGNFGIAGTYASHKLGLHPKGSEYNLAKEATGAVLGQFGMAGEYAMQKLFPYRQSKTKKVQNTNSKAKIEKQTEPADLYATFWQEQSTQFEAVRDAVVSDFSAVQRDIDFASDKLVQAIEQAAGRLRGAGASGAKKGDEYLTFGGGISPKEKSGLSLLDLLGLKNLGKYAPVALGLIRKLFLPVLAAEITHELDKDSSVAGGSRIGSFIDKYVPGAAGIDEWAYRHSGGMVGTKDATSVYNRNKLSPTEKILSSPLGILLNPAGKLKQDWNNITHTPQTHAPTIPEMLFSRPWGELKELFGGPRVEGKDSGKTSSSRADKITYDVARSITFSANEITFRSPIINLGNVKGGGASSQTNQGTPTKTSAPPSLSQMMFSRPWAEIKELGGMVSHFFGGGGTAGTGGARGVAGPGGGPAAPPYIPTAKSPYTTSDIMDAVTGKANRGYNPPGGPSGPIGGGANTKIGYVSPKEMYYEIMNNPQLKRDFYMHAIGENNNRTANQGVMEEARNRAMMRAMTHGGYKGFAAYGNLAYFIGNRPYSKAEERMMDENMRKVFLENSDITKGAIDNLSQGPAARTEALHRFKVLATYGGRGGDNRPGVLGAESFLRPDQAESGRGEREGWAQMRALQLRAMQTPEPGAPQVDYPQADLGARASILPQNVTPTSQNSQTQGEGIINPYSKITEPKEVSEARAYLAKTATVGGTMQAQGVEAAIARLHPEFALRAAAGIKKLRENGFPNAGLNSAFRTGSGPAGTGSKFDVAGESIHTIGGASDFAGIGPAGSAQAVKAHQILDSVGLYGVYGPYNRAEYNHFQLVPQKSVGALGGDSREVQKLAGSEIPSPENLQKLWRMTKVPLPGGNGTANNINKGKIALGLDGMGYERFVDGKKFHNVQEVKDYIHSSMARIAKAKGYDGIEFVSATGDNVPAQIKAAQERVNQGGIGGIIGYSAGANSLGHVKGDFERIPIAGGQHGNVGAYFPGVQHIDQVNALADHLESTTQTVSVSPRPSRPTASGAPPAFIGTYQALPFGKGGAASAALGATPVQTSSVSTRKFNIPDIPAGMGGFVVKALKSEGIQLTPEQEKRIGGGGKITEDDLKGLSPEQLDKANSLIQGYGYAPLYTDKAPSPTPAATEPAAAPAVPAKPEITVNPRPGYYKDQINEDDNKAPSPAPEKSDDEPEQHSDLEHEHKVAYSQQQKQHPFLNKATNEPNLSYTDLVGSDQTYA